MEIILCRDVPKLGKSGQLVRVKTGYARNYLFPRKLACEATPGNRQRVERQRAKQDAANAEIRQQAQDLAAKLEKVSCTVTVEVNDREKLYGSVTETDIVKALDVEGFQVDKKDIELENPIEELGIYEVGVRLHPEVKAKIRLWVAKK